MAVKRWTLVGLLLMMLLVVAGCGAQAQVQPPAPKSNGVLVSGRYSTEQGTMRYQREFQIHPDGRVTEIQMVQGTHKFADFWRDRYLQITAAGLNDYKLSKEERGSTFVIRAEKTFESMEQLNESGVAELQLINGPLFRSVAFKSHTGRYDPEAMVETYGSHEQATAEDWVHFLEDAILVGYVIKDEESGLTYRWDRTAGEIGSGLPVVIQGKQWHTSAYLGGAGVGLFLVFVLYMGVFGRRHWEKRDDEDVEL